ncbi:MAG: S41 family peptidase [Thermoguttaceae bacterium]
MQRLLVDALDQVERNYVREISRRKLVEAAIKGILTELDPYSSYIGPDQIEGFRETLESEFGGIGIQVAVERGQLRVISPLPGTPACRAGILAGDRIVEIDGKSTDRITVDEAVRRLKGKIGTQVRLVVIHPGKSSKERITVTRQLIRIPTVLGSRRRPDGSWDFMLEPEKRIAYIRITAFSRETAEDLCRVLAELQKQKMRGLVLDLRFNPGGLLSAAVEVADAFVAEGRIVSTSGRNSPERVWEARKPGTFDGFPMAVLVNRYSASASEIVAACLQDHKRAVVVGERTWGKGSVQNLIPLEDASDSGQANPEPRRPEPRSALKLTTAGYRRPNGQTIDRAPDAKDTDPWGVAPDKGYELKLDDREMFALYAEQRRRDAAAPELLAEPADPQRAEGAFPSKPEDSQPAPSSGGSAAEPPPAKGPPSSAEGNPEFVDRQLQLALGYLTAELARAD